MTKIIFMALYKILGILLLFPFSSFTPQGKPEGFSLKIEVNGLRNSEGTVLFALYNREDAFPDEHYKKYYRKLSGKIVCGASMVTFENLPEGKYAVNILHDEDDDGKIKKGIVLPKEGIGFSNYQSISIFNRPAFSKASFNLRGDRSLMVKMIYL